MTPPVEVAGRQLQRLDVEEEVPWAKSKDVKEQRRDRVRATLAYVLVGVFSGTLLVVFGDVLFSQDGEGALETWKELLPLILPVETTLLGTALGFYYGYGAGQKQEEGD